jgi:hypothetical protein
MDIEAENGWLTGKRIFKGATSRRITTPWAAGQDSLRAAGGIAALGAGLALSISEAMDAQGVQAQLAQVLKSTGGAAGVTADMANDLASSLTSVTRFGDEAILSGENLLLTFTGIGKDVFPAATEVMLDMSQAMGQDLKSSAIQLGKALNDPAEGMTALTRVGVTFTEEQKKQVGQWWQPATWPAGDHPGRAAKGIRGLGQSSRGDLRRAARYTQEFTIERGRRGGDGAPPHPVRPGENVIMPAGR